MTSYDVIILGAGGAGLMCAGIVGQRGKNVLVLDHADKPGKKILISGGGRCNFTNTGTAPENFLSDNPHFAKSALSRYTPWDFIDLVNRHKIDWHEKTLGQLFCDGSARQIVKMLRDECPATVSLALSTPITDVSHNDALYRVNNEYEAPALVIATGGPSIPKMGATGFAYDLARQFGLNVVTPRPALVPLTLGPDDLLFKGLSGVSTETIATVGTTSFNEASLFTHKGLSGPAILQISSHWEQGDEIALNLLPQLQSNWLKEAKSSQPRSQIKTALNAHLPTRLADAIATRLDIRTELANLPDKTLQEIAEKLSHWTFAPTGTEGYAKAEVTAGGIDTRDLNSKTMEAKTRPGLYAIGEAVDVTGWLGGYNFQWAWASGWAAAQAL